MKELCYYQSMRFLWPHSDFCGEAILITKFYKVLLFFCFAGGDGTFMTHHSFHFEFQF